MRLALLLSRGPFALMIATHQPWAATGHGKPVDCASAHGKPMDCASRTGGKGAKSAPLSPAHRWCVEGAVSTPPTKK